VVRHFAEMSDLIVFFFDPDKPGTTGESLQVMTQALSGVGHKLLIIMNKVDLFPNIRDFARAYGALCWNLAHVIKTKDLPHIFCTYVETDANKNAVMTHLPLGDFQKSRNEVIAEIDRAPERRSDNLVSTLYDTARRLQMHARVSSALSSQHQSWKTKTWLASIGIVILTGLIGFYFYKMDQPALKRPEVYGSLIGGLLIAFLVLWIGGLIVKRLSAVSIAGIDAIFQKEYEREFTMQDKADLEAVWQDAKPQTLDYLAKTQIENVPRRTIFNKTLFEKVDAAIANDIPTLRRDLTKK